jgi:SAM-dependent methyltransferase
MADLGSDLEKLKSNLRAAWMAGDFGVIARYSEREAKAFIDRLPILPGTTVLDVACGTGNVAIPAAHFPPSPTPPAATVWGNEAAARELFGDRVIDLRFARRLHRFDFPFREAETVELMRRYVGPFQRAFESLDAEKQLQLRQDLS